MTMLLDAEPQLQQPEVLTPTPEVISIGDQDYFVYEMPPNSERTGSTPNKFATNQPEVLEKVLNGGLSALEDGEGFLMAGINDHANSADVTGFFRRGDGLLIYARQHEKISGREHTAKVREPLRVEAGNTDAYFTQELVALTADRGIRLADKGGKLGRTVAEIGFASESPDSPVPLPEPLVRNIQIAQDAGIMIPVVRFTKEAQIDSEPYVDTWGDEEFPASEQPTYFTHDLLQEHFAPLVVFRGDAMIVGSLYAKAVKEADEITAMVLADEYQINNDRPELKEVQLSGEQKMDHAADCLDNFTNDLSDASREIEHDVNDPDIQMSFSEHPTNSWRRMPQMVQTILNSSHRQEFIDYLRSNGFTALNEETNEFSYETYVKEAFLRAQAFWEITPKTSHRTEKAVHPGVTI